MSLALLRGLLALTNQWNLSMLRDTEVSLGFNDQPVIIRFNLIKNTMVCLGNSKLHNKTFSPFETPTGWPSLWPTTHPAL